MLSEYERNMNVMRVLLALHEEGATDELADCAADGEPWTEEDRRKSRAYADWLRATFFPPPPRSRHRSNAKQLFTDEQLWAELEVVDRERREAAVAAIHALAQLASLRAKQSGTRFIEERQWIYDIERLQYDVERGDVALREAALRVWDDVSHLQGLIAMAEPITDEARARAEKLRELVLAKLAERERAEERAHVEACLAGIGANR